MNKLLRTENRIKESLRQIRQAFTKSKTPVTEHMKEQYRMRYYNVKALQLLLANNVFVWNNCKNEESLLAQLQEHSLVPSLEHWHTEYHTFVQDCIDSKLKREQEREAAQLWLNKQQHLVRLKQLKLQSHINQLKLHRGVTVIVGSSFVYTHGQKCRVEGRYNIRISIDSAEQSLSLQYDQVDKCLDKLLDIIKQINHMVPQLRKQIALDSKNHGTPLYLGADHFHTSLYDIANKLYLTDIPGFSEPISDTSDLTSSNTINTINRLIEDFNHGEL